MMKSSWRLWWCPSVLRLADTCPLPLGPSAQLLVPQGSCGPICPHWLLLEALGDIISSRFIADVITVFFVTWSLFLFFCGGGIHGDLKSSIITSTQLFAKTHSFKKFFSSQPLLFFQVESHTICFSFCLPKSLFLFPFCSSVDLVSSSHLLRSHCGFNLDYFRSCVHHCFNSALEGAHRLHASDV